GAGKPSGFAHIGADGPTGGLGLGTDVRASDLSAGKFRGPGAVQGHLLPSGELDRGRPNDRTRQRFADVEAEPVDETDSGAAGASAFSPVAMSMRPGGAVRSGLSPVEFDAMMARLGAAPADVLSLYLRLVPPASFAQLGQQERLRRQNNRVYTNAVVIWLMILQRLADGSMETAVLELLRTLPPEFWPQPCKRLEAGYGDSKAKLSSHTGSYNQARQELPL